MTSERASQHAFLRRLSAALRRQRSVTIIWCASMSAMGEMPMPGGWTMSMAWMRLAPAMITAGQGAIVASGNTSALRGKSFFAGVGRDKATPSY
jgi:hypothetical protein